jgi:hypothetical protein
MRTRARRATLALVLPGILLTATGVANAYCTAVACADLPPAVDNYIGPIIHDDDGGNGPGGAPCLYSKDEWPPPSDWQGDYQHDQPPYYFWRTKAWGDSAAHPRYVDWDSRACVLLCPPRSPDANSFSLTCPPE